MIDLEKVSQIKERMLSIIRVKGPSLPIPIAKSVNLSPLFASAFLSELFSERKVFMSHMKIGSSSLYLLPGQEPMLEGFIDQLNNREREAIHILKIKKLLDDEALTPVVRVALRSTKDFAIPVRIKIDGDTRLFWKYFLVPDSEIKNILQETILKTESVKQPVPVNESIPARELKQELTKPKEIEQQMPIEPLKEEIKPIEIKKEELIAKSEQELTIKTETKPKIKKEKKQKSKESDFSKKIKDYLQSKEIEILEIIEEKPKEFISKVRLDDIFGKQEYYLVAKDKKKISELDLIVALQKAQHYKTLALIIAPGELDKKAQEEIKNWKNLIKFHKVKL